MEPKPSYGEQDGHFWMITGINVFLIFLVFISIMAIILSAYNSHWGHFVAWFIVGFISLFIFRHVPMPLTFSQRIAKAQRDEWFKKTGRYR